MAQNINIDEIKALLHQREEELSINEIPEFPFASPDDLQKVSIGIGRDYIASSIPRDKICDAIVSSAIEQLRNKKLRHYLHEIINVQPTSYFNIRYVDINVAIDRLGLRNNNDYLTFFVGCFDSQNLPINNNAICVQTFGSSAMIICRKNNLPLITGNTAVDSTHGFERIGNNLFFMNQGEIIKVGTFATVETFAGFSYLRINVFTDFVNNEMDLGKIPHVGALLP